MGDFFEQRKEQKQVADVGLPQITALLFVICEQASAVQDVWWAGKESAVFIIAEVEDEIH